MMRYLHIVDVVSKKEINFDILDYKKVDFNDLKLKHTSNDIKGRY